MEKGPLDKHTEELLSAYFGGELEGLELQRVEGWLADVTEACTVCLTNRYTILA